MNKLLISLLLFCTLCSCATQNILMESRAEQKAMSTKIDSAFQYDPAYQYKIQKDDKISISVWGQDELSVGSVYGIYNSNEVYGKWLLVDISGNIEAPKVGTLHVENKTVKELKDTLRSVFKEKIVNPIVDVKVLNKEITVLGEVRNPGIFQTDKDNNLLLETIARSGGFEPYANLKQIKVLRQEGEHVRMATIDLTSSGMLLQKNIQLHPRDVVVVPSKNYKEFDRRISVIIPFTTAITAASILLGVF